MQLIAIQAKLDDEILFDIAQVRAIIYALSYPLTQMQVLMDKFMTLPPPPELCALLKILHKEVSLGFIPFSFHLSFVFRSSPSSPSRPQ